LGLGGLSISMVEHARLEWPPAMEVGECNGAGSLASE